jgi:hypothetical protein
MDKKKKKKEIITQFPTELIKADKFILKLQYHQEIKQLGNFNSTKPKHEVKA